MLFGPGLIVCSAEPATYGSGDPGFEGPDSVQNAINTLSGLGISGTVLMLPGLYNPFSVGISEVKVTGPGRSALVDGTITSHAVTVTGSDVVLENFAVATTALGGQNFDGVFLNGPRGRLNGLICEQSDRYGYHIGPLGDDAILGQNRTVQSDDDAVFIDTNGENNVVGVNRLAGWTGEAIDDDSGTSVHANLNDETA
jgi:hypothetical protein